MFEEHMDDQNSGASSGQVPGNLPMTEPEDIFGGGEMSPPGVMPTTKATSSQQMEPQSMSTSSQKSALSAGVLKPKVSENVMPVTSEYPVSQSHNSATEVPMMVPHDEFENEIPGIRHPEMQEVYNLKDPNFGRAILKILLGIIILGLIFFGGWYVYGKFIAGDTTSEDKMKAEDNANANPFETQENTDDTIDLNEDLNSGAILDINEDPTQNMSTSSDKMTSTTKDTMMDETSSTTEQTNEDSGDDSVLFGDIDKDEDGLNNIRENALGTDQNNWDTDGDELGDGEEVNIWKTDPLNPDTDGDGYKDGPEVKAGYSPLGAHKLSEKPIEGSTEIDTTVQQ